MNKYGEPAQVSEDEVRELSNNFLNSIIGKGDFLDIMAHPEKYELYFFKNDAEETIGVLTLVFSDKSCYIAEFAVFDRGKGLGTDLSQVLANFGRSLVLRLSIIAILCSKKQFGFVTKSKDDTQQKATR